LSQGDGDFDSQLSDFFGDTLFAKGTHLRVDISNKDEMILHMLHSKFRVAGSSSPTITDTPSTPPEQPEERSLWRGGRHISGKVVTAAPLFCLTGMANNVIIVIVDLTDKEVKPSTGGRTGTTRAKGIWNGQGWI